PGLHLRAMKDELLTAGQRRVGAGPGEALPQHGLAVGTCEARARPDLGRSWRRGRGPELPDTAHCLPEQTRLVIFLVRFVIAWGNHTSSAARLSYSIVSRTFGGSIPFRSEDPGQQRRRLSRRGRPPPARGPRDARRGDRRRA